MNRPRPPGPARRASTSRRASPSSKTSPASDNVERLRRILRYEQRLGCKDEAVMGGLDKLLANALDDPSVADFLAPAPLPRGYAGLKQAERKTWIEAVLEGKTPPKPRAATKQRASAASRARTPHSEAPPGTRDPLDQPVTVVRGIKAGLQARLARLEVHTVRNLLYLFPNRHNDFANVRTIAELIPNEEQTALVDVWNARVARLGYRPGTEATVGDGSGTMRVVWFNQPYLADQLHTNDRIVLAGKVGLFNGKKTMENPEWERLEGDDLTHTGRLVPVYPLTQGLSQRILRRAAKEAVDKFSPAVVETLPPPIRTRQKLIGLADAVRQMHYPDSAERYEQARRRIAFDELLAVQVAVMERRQEWQEGQAAAFSLDRTLETYRAALPFSLTNAQERVLADILRDLQSNRPMARLLQGDVGSGKTAVAGAALVTAVANGYQGALMAPTEILAEQHFRTLSSLIGGMEIDGRKLRVEMLVGSMTPGAKRAMADAVAAGEVDVVVGTHALIQEGVSFRRLGVAVVDEQHRFGVMQRAALRENAIANNQPTPHLLVMSATPIPRTLALTFFGDLDVSVIDELPPGRLPVATRWVGPDERADSYAFVRDQIWQGRQAFVVCPLIEESAALQTRSAVQEYERLSTRVFPELRVGLLHGRMSGAEKDSVLQAFRRGELHVLVATTVIEVGIDIPNASVMVIEGADRFGLAQMHQLRGRVGRGAAQSYCLLLSDDPSYTARQRLQLLEDLNDGFALAEADLRLRGPGDYFGTRQSGMPEFKVAELSDVGLIECARQEAMRLLEEDPQLRKPEHAALSAAVARARQTVSGDVS